jgi:hypothetical protein
VPDTLNQIVSRFRRLEQTSRQFGYDWLISERNRTYDELMEELGSQRAALKDAMGDLIELHQHVCEFDPKEELCVYCYLARERSR